MLKTNIKTVFLSILISALVCSQIGNAGYIGDSDTVIRLGKFSITPYSYVIEPYNSTYYQSINASGYEYKSTNVSKVSEFAQGNCSGGTILWKQGYYSIPTDYLALTKSNIKMVGDDAILDFGVSNPANSHEGGILALSVSNITIKGFKILQSDRAGIKIRQSNNVHIEDNYVYACWSGIISESSSDVWIERNKINITDGDGIYITAYPLTVAYNNTFILNNLLYTIGDTGIDLSGGTSLGKCFIVHGNLVDGYNPSTDSGTPNGGGLSDASTTTEVLFSDNIVKNTKYGASINGDGTTMINNEFLDFVGSSTIYAYGVTFSSDNSTISGGLIRNSPNPINLTSYGIRCWGGAYQVISNVEIVNMVSFARQKGNESYGIYLNGSTCYYSTIIGCKILDWNNASIIDNASFGCTGAIILGNTCKDRRTGVNVAYGIRQSNGGTMNWTIAHNYIANVIEPIRSSGHGVYISDNVGYNPVWVIATPVSSGYLFDTTGTGTMANATLYENTGSAKAIYVSGGTVISIEIDGTATGLTSGSFMLATHETIKVTWSAPPTITVVGQ